MNDKIIEFLLLQIQLTQLRKINTYYRGDNLENIYKRFGVNNDGTEYKRKELLERIFLIGDKSKYFYNDLLFDDKSFSRDIALVDTSDEALKKIFERLNKSTKSKKEYISQYYRENSAINEYFKNKANLPSFINSINNSENPLVYRNYYLKILHQLYFIDYRKNSHFVSSTEDKNISKNFAGENGIIIHCWNPNFYFYRKKFEINNLPKQDTLAFKKQKEFSFLAGILPHFISAVEFTENKKVYFNPTILKSYIDSKLFLEGLDIDQSEFVEIVSKTEFRKYFSRNGLKNSEYNVSR